MKIAQYKAATEKLKEFERLARAHRGEPYDDHEWVFWAMTKSSIIQDVMIDIGRSMAETIDKAALECLLTTKTK